MIMKREHELYAIVTRLYSNHDDVEDTYRFIGEPCWGWDDAWDYAVNSLVPNVELYNITYINDGAKADLVDTETGEVYGELLIKKIGLF